MGRPFALLFAASLGLASAPALAQQPPPQLPPAAPTYGAPAPYGQPVPYGQPAPYGAPPYVSRVGYGNYGPYTPMTPPPQSERRSTGMMVTGIVMVAVGFTAIVAGTALYASNLGSCVITSVPPGEPPPTRCPDDPSHVIGMAFMIPGAIVAAVGIPLWIYGAGSVPAGQDRRAARAPSVLVSPRGVALRWVF